MRMCLPGEKTWTPGVCAGLVGPQSYEVKVGDRNFVRNRRQLIKSSDHVVEKLEEEPAQQENVEGLRQRA